MTESERVARELLAYRDNPPVRQAGLVEGQWYESGDILRIIMAPRCEFTTHELLTRLAELMWRGTCHVAYKHPDYPCSNDEICSECGASFYFIGEVNYCPSCGRKVVDE